MLDSTSRPGHGCGELPGARAALAAGIDVVSCINVQHLESLSDRAQDLTGVAATETVPDAVVAAADQVDLIGVYVREPSGLVESEPVWLEEQRRLLVELGGRYAEITGADVAMAILDFARAEQAGQLVLGVTRRTRPYGALHGSVITRTIRHAGPVEVHLVSALKPPKHPLTAHPRRPARRRRVNLPPGDSSPAGCWQSRLRLP